MSDEKTEKIEVVAIDGKYVGDDCIIEAVYDTIHVYPIEDLHPHNTSGSGVCWCDPYFDIDGLGNRVCVHKLFESERIPEGEAIH